MKGAITLATTIVTYYNVTEFSRAPRAGAVASDVTDGRQIVNNKADSNLAWLVLLGSFGCHFLNGSVYFSVGTIHVSLLARFGESETVTSWAGALYTSFMACSGVIASVLINRYSCRLSSLVGVLLMVSGLLSSAFVNELVPVIILYGCLAGIGSGIVYTTQLVALAMNFDRHRNIAGGIATSGAGLGAFILSPLIQRAREEYGDKEMFIIVGAIALNMAVFSTMYFPSKLEHEQRAARMWSQAYQDNGVSSCRHHCHQLSVISNKSFQATLASLFLCNVGVAIIFVHLVGFSISHGVPDFQASFLAAIVGLSGCCGRLLTGMMANSGQVDEFLIFFGTPAVLGILTLLVPLYGDQYPGQVMFAVAVGVYSGCVYPVLNSITASLVGLTHLSTSIGLEMFLIGIASLIGPPLAGSLVDENLGYNFVFIVSGLTNVAGAGFALLSSAIRRSPELNKSMPENQGLTSQRSSLAADGVACPQKDQTIGENCAKDLANSGMIILSPFGSNLTLSSKKSFELL